ncbi:MAG TPA: hypothetical protein VGS19_29785 [Streptosporangiaceae bacterium]|nr:hypothetical protein [Streptosporangiaceae bacterium]
MEDAQALRLQALLAEYDSLRNESLACISNRIMVANFTFGALALILAALVTRTKPNATVGIVSLFFVPQVAKTGLLIWLGEYDRSQRAGHWLTGVEERINNILDREVMTWEGSLQHTGTHMGYPYLATVLLLLGAGWASSLVGIVMIHQANTSPAIHHDILWITVGLTTYALTVELLFGWFFRNKWRDIRTRYGAIYPPAPARPTGPQSLEKNAGKS